MSPILRAMIDAGLYTVPAGESRAEVERVEAMAKAIGAAVAAEMEKNGALPVADMVMALDALVSAQTGVTAVTLLLPIASPAGK